jgi:probable O-glycosylation ligase (exosortase A-associated)
LLRSIAFIVLMTAGTIAAVLNRFAALLVYLWFALFRPQEWVWTDITNLHLSFVLGAILVVPSLLGGIFPNLSHPLSIGAVLFLLTGLLAQTSAVRPDIAWEWIDYLARLILVSLLLVTMVSTRRRFVLTVTVIAASLGYHSAKAGLATVLGGGVRFAAGFAGAFGDNNGYALAVVMILPFLLAAGQNAVSELPGGRWVRWAFLVSVPFSALTVISTFSRGGFVALAASVVVFILLQRRRTAIAIAAAVVSLIVIPLVPVPEGYLARITTIRTYESIEEDSALSRLHFWNVAMAMARDKPLGVGLRNFESAYDYYDFLNGRYGHERSVHSSHFQALAETGYLGFAIWGTLFLVALWTVLRIRARAQHAALSPADRHFLFTMANALAVSMCGFVVGGSFIAGMLNDVTWLTFALVAALDRLSARMISEAEETASQALPAERSSPGPPPETFSWA